jgi:hypothetical protein
MSAIMGPGSAFDGDLWLGDVGLGVGVHLGRHGAGWYDYI